MSYEVFIDGDADAIQLRVQGNTTQTNPLQTWEDSEAHVLAQVDENGQVLIDGQQDQVQLRVQAHSTQTDPLQTWEKSDGTPLAQITGDGRLELGDLDLGTPDALIEANRDITMPDSVTPRRGVQSQGKMTGDDTAVVDGVTDWSVHELELAGDAGVGGTHTALRAKITQANTGDSDQAELRAGGFEAIVEGGNNTHRVSEAVGVHSQVTNEQTGHLDQAVGVKVTLHDEGTDPIQNAYGLLVEDVDQGAQASYAIHTGAGTVRLGDDLEMPEKGATPADPPVGSRKLYPKSDGWYDLDSSGNENKLGSGAGGGSVTSVGLALPTDVFDVGGSPVTGSGTLTATFDDQAAHDIFAGPASGGAATPAFRALVAADIPSLTAAKITDFDTEVSNNTDVAANTAHRQITSGNPHNVAAADVGNTVAQWNADQLQRAHYRHDRTHGRTSPGLG